MVNIQEEPWQKKRCWKKQEKKENKEDKEYEN